MKAFESAFGTSLFQRSESAKSVCPVLFADVHGQGKLVIAINIIDGHLFMPSGEIVAIVPRVGTHAHYFVLIVTERGSVVDLYRLVA